MHRFAISMGSILWFYSLRKYVTVCGLYFWQGNRTTNIGIVDSEYVIHLGLPTLGGSAGSKVNGFCILRACKQPLVFSL